MNWEHVSWFVICIAGFGVPGSAGTQTEKERDPLQEIMGSGPAEDRAAVVRVLHDYLRVTDAQDQAAIATAFHPTALLSSVTATGAVSALTQDAWWERVARISPNTPVRISKIVLVDTAGISGVARIDITDAQGNNSTDFFTLLKTKSGWRIVNKTLSVPL